MKLQTAILATLTILTIAPSANAKVQNAAEYCQSNNVALTLVHLNAKAQWPGNEAKVAKFEDLRDRVETACTKTGVSYKSVTQPLTKIVNLLSK